MFKPGALEFHRAIDLPELENRYPSSMLVGRDHLYITLPQSGRILQLSKDGVFKNWGFFKGDQLIPREYEFKEPVAVIRNDVNVFLVCDSRGDYISVFDKDGQNLYADAPPGLIEHYFRRPLAIHYQNTRIAVLAEDPPLGVIEPNGEIKIFYPALLKQLRSHRRAGLFFGGDRVYFLIPGEPLAVLDTLSGKCSVIDLTAQIGFGVLQSFSFDRNGRLYLSVDNMPAIVVLDSESGDILARYDFVDYRQGSGGLRSPRTLAVGSPGEIYLLDSNRLLVFHYEPTTADDASSDDLSGNVEIDSGQIGECGEQSEAIANESNETIREALEE